VLALWLKQTREQNNDTLITPILKALRKLPITVKDLLGAAGLGKLIKKLVSAGVSDESRALSKSLMESWSTLIASTLINKEAPAGEIEEKKRKPTSTVTPTAKRTKPEPPKPAKKENDAKFDIFKSLTQPLPKIKRAPVEPTPAQVPTAKRKRPETEGPKSIKTTQLASSGPEALLEPIESQPIASYRRERYRN
jgi:hypothetical protein